MAGGAPVKKYLCLLKCLYSNRLSGEGYLTADSIERNSGTTFPSKSIYGVLRELTRRKLIKKRNSTRPFSWKITPSGIRYLAMKGVIPKDEAEAAAKEMERYSWLG
jgi:DNA-binding PadR family transcriptional regulator